MPGSAFIYPLMSQVERLGIATDLLAEPTRGVPFDAGARVILRVAAWSMLQEPAEHAPYGWSHCLTMPQAVLAVAAVVHQPLRGARDRGDLRRRISARRWLLNPLDPSWTPIAPDIDLPRALEEDPASARRRGVARPSFHVPRGHERARDPRRDASRRPSREVHPRLPRRRGLGHVVRAPLPRRGGATARGVGRTRRGYTCDCRRTCLTDAVMTFCNTFWSTSSSRLM